LFRYRNRTGEWLGRASLNDLKIKTGDFRRPNSNGTPRQSDCKWLAPAAKDGRREKMSQTPKVAQFAKRRWLTAQADRVKTPI